MTAVKGHLTAVEFPADFKKWEYPPPERLFDAPVLTTIPNVSVAANPPRIFDRLRILTSSAGQQEHCQEH